MTGEELRARIDRALRVGRVVDPDDGGVAFHDGSGYGVHTSPAALVDVIAAAVEDATGSAALERVRRECDLVEADVHGLDDDHADGMRDCVARVRASMPSGDDANAGL